MNKTILQRLISINSTNLPGNEMDMVKIILEYFPKNIKHQVIDHGNNRASLMIEIPGENKKSIAFIGHIDTVPVADEDAWEYPPFEGRIVDKYIYGRGASDMKGGVTAMIMTALHLIEEGIVPPYTIKFFFTADEESDGMGIKSIVNMGLLNDVIKIIIPEPSDEKIGLCEKGAIWFELEVKGKSSHASKPELGANAIDGLILFSKQLEDTIDLRSEHPLLGKGSFSLTQISGGVKTNIIPDEATGTIDIRTIPGMDHNDIINNAEKIAKKLTNKNTNINIKINITNNRLPVSIDKEDDFIREIVAVYNQLSYPVDFKGINFYTDASQVIPFHHIPFVILGPGEENMAHQKNERIEIKSVDRMGKLYIHYILSL